MNIEPIHPISAKNIPARLSTYIKINYFFPLQAVFLKNSNDSP